jgi:site-specific DNA recombinase
VAKRLAKLYAALETGQVALDDLAPLLKELRVQQRELQERRDELLDKMNSESTHVLDLKATQEYTLDLKNLLKSASFLEQKAFLRSFVKRMEFDLPQVEHRLHATLPLEDGLTSTSEVLRINKTGSPIITFPHQKVETFFEVAIAHTPQIGGDWDSLERFRPWHRA